MKELKHGRLEIVRETALCSRLYCLLACLSAGASQSLELKPVEVIYVHNLPASGSSNAAGTLSNGVSPLIRPTRSALYSGLCITGCSGHLRYAVSRFSKVYQRPVDNHPEAAAELELVLHNAKANNQHKYSKRKSDRPEQPLSLPHLSHIYCIHRQNTADEGERQKYDGHGREYEYCLAVVFPSDFDGISGLRFWKQRQCHCLQVAKEL